MAARHRLFACSVTAAAVGLSAPGCSYMDPYGRLKPQQGEDAVTALYPRLERVPAATSQSASLALDGRLGFVGALPEQIQRTEARRGQLIALMNDMEDERTAYDAAVWTVAPWLVYRLVTPGYSDLNVQQADARMFVFQAGVNLDEIVRAVNRVGAAPGDLVAILEALRSAGALRAELVVI